jgi:hypothetical protein
MAKRRRRITEKLIKRWLKEGRGQGEGAQYKPWLTIQDVPSQGRCHRIHNLHTGRVHHLLSDLELHIYFIYVWSSPPVIDIMEQYPLLPLEETIAIAEQLGIPYPKDPSTRHPIVLTSDFFLKVNVNLHHEYYVRTAKYLADLDNLRTREKLEIERRYWEVRNKDWAIVTEQTISVPLIENIKWVYPYYHPTSLYPLIPTEIEKIAALLTRRVLEIDAPLRSITSACDDELNLSKGRSLAVVRHLIARRFWKVDMTERIHQGKRLPLTDVPNGTLYGSKRVAA